MLTASQKVGYLFDSIMRHFTEVKCPYCNSLTHKKIDSKYFVTRLFECNVCHLCFRHPVEKIGGNEKFYQKEYKETDNITATMPDKKSLDDIIQAEFRIGNKSADRYLKIFQSLFPDRQKLNIIDYGSSWGYISYQFRKAGHNVQSYEISKIRAEYGNKNLQLDIKVNEAELNEGADIFFSSHVIELHPDIKSMLNLSGKLLKKEGFFIAVSPNGSEAYRESNFDSFHHSWGKVHPNYLTDKFYEHLFANNPFYIGSSPFCFDEIEKFGNEQVIGDLTNEELIVIAKQNLIIGE